MGIAPQAAPRVSHQPSLRPPQFQPSYQALLQISQVLVRQWTPRPLSTMPAIKHSPPLNELHPAVALFSRSALAAPSIEPSLVGVHGCLQWPHTAISSSHLSLGRSQDPGPGGT